MKEPVAKPTTIELPMKPRDRTAACPDETRCQLEVIWDDGRGALTVHDGPRDSKLVQVGLIGEKGCDAKVRVGMIETGGAFAVGRTPSVVDGSVVHRTWERRLLDCVDPDELFWHGPPLGLLNVRYTLKGEVVVLSVAHMASEREWQVHVTRRGGVAPVPPLRLSYDYTDDSLVVSAALSANLRALYIVESKLSGLTYVGIYHYYSLDIVSGVWQLVRSGEVPRPSAAASARPYYVDRNGDVSGYWATEWDVTSETYSDDGTCQAQLADPGEYRTRAVVSFSAVHGGVWSIPAAAARTGARRRRGVAMSGGDLATVEENLRWSSGHIRQSYSYSWSSTIIAPNHFVYRRGESSSHDTGFEFEVTIGDVYLGRVNDQGLSAISSGTYAADVEILSDLSLPPPGWGWFGSGTMAFRSYTYREGSVSISVSHGGWVSRAEDSTVKTCDNYEAVVEDISALGNWSAGCPSPVTALEERTSESHELSSRIIYPVAIGDFVTIGRSFTAIDVATNTAYVGVYAQFVENGAFAWRIFRNGQEITDAVASCIGRPMDQLYAIYWRL